MILETMQMSLASEEQDENDRKSMALLGSRGTMQSGADGSDPAQTGEQSRNENQLPQRRQTSIDEVRNQNRSVSPPPKFMESPRGGGGKKNKDKDDKKPIFEMDTKCMSCSGQLAGGLL